MIDFHSVLIGDGKDFDERESKKAQENIAKMTPEERRNGFNSVFIGCQRALEEVNREYEAVKDKTYQDIKHELGGKFTGDPKSGVQTFSQITGKTFNLDDSHFSELKNRNPKIDDLSEELVNSSSLAENSSQEVDELATSVSGNSESKQEEIERTLSQHLTQDPQTYNKVSEKIGHQGYLNSLSKLLEEAKNLVKKITKSTTEELLKQVSKIKKDLYNFQFSTNS